MNLLKEGGSIVRPPFLDETNYGYWKAWMLAFIKSMDELAWKAVLTCWSPPTKEDESSKEVPKSKLEWTIEEDKKSSNNWKTLNAIFNGVSSMQFKIIHYKKIAF